MLPLLSRHAGPADGPGLTVSIDWPRGAVVLRGELDRAWAHHLLDAVSALGSTAHPCWIVDTADVTWCDAGGLRALAAAHALAVDSGRELRLVRSSRCVDRLVTLSGLDRLIADGLPSYTRGRPTSASTGPAGRPALRHREHASG